MQKMATPEEQIDSFDVPLTTRYWKDYRKATSGRDPQGFANAVGATAGALTGAGLGWYINKLRRRNKLVGALVGVGIGGAGGALVQQVASHGFRRNQQEGEWQLMRAATDAVENKAEANRLRRLQRRSLDPLEKYYMQEFLQRVPSLLRWVKGADDNWDDSVNAGKSMHEKGWTIRD